MNVFDHIPWIRIVASCGNSISNFLRNYLMVLATAIPSTFHNNAQGSKFLHIFTNSCYFLCLFCFNISHHNGYGLISHCDLICISLRKSNGDHCFMSLLIIHIWLIYLQVLCAFFEPSCFLLLSFRSPPYTLDIKNLINFMICEYFLSSCGFSFYSTHSVFWFTIEII